MPPVHGRRPRLVAGNWKMHKTPAEGAALARELVAISGGDPSASDRRCRVVLCPPYPALAAVGAALMGSRLQLGGQNLHAEAQGAFTGEVSGAMLAACGCTFVIVGHSERRHGMGEDDLTVARKARAALRDGLAPIICVGETLAERESGRMSEVLVRQTASAFDGLSADAARTTIVAYEPVWAIGTGRVATPEQAREAHELIRATLDRVAGAGAGNEIAILYGGSVNAGNAAALFAEAEVDGALVGGASLEAATFWKIQAAASGP